MFGETLKKLRKEHGMTQAQLAEKLGISTSAVGMYEQNRREPNAEMIRKLCELFAISTDRLIIGRDHTAHAPPQELTELVRYLHDTLVSAPNLMFNGAVLSCRDKQQVLDAIDLGIRIALERLLHNKQ